MFIQGPAGPIEAMLEQPIDNGAAVAILCHPHPMYGGSMNDAVLGLVGEALAEVGVNRLRFNFRGVGESRGRFDEGRGEADDLLAVIDWAQAQAAGAIWRATPSAPTSFAKRCPVRRSPTACCWWRRQQRQWR